MTACARCGCQLLGYEGRVCLRCDFALADDDEDDEAPPEALEAAAERYQERRDWLQDDGCQDEDEKGDDRE